MYLSVSRCYIFCFRQGQECARCEQIAALNKNAGDFITLSFYHYIVLMLSSNSPMSISSKI